MFKKENISTRNSSLKEKTYDYTDDYGGIFLDEQGILNVLTVNSDLPNNTQKRNIYFSENTFDNVQVKNVEFSYNYLEEIQNALIEVMEQYAIVGVGIKQEENRVDIMIKSGENTKEDIINYLIDKSLYDENAVCFMENEGLEETSVAKAGTKIWYRYGFLWLKESYGTIGANVIDNSTGQKGILTNAHVAVAGKTMKHDEGTIGERSKGWYGGTIDAAFVPFGSSSWNVTDQAYGDDHLTYGNINLGNENQIVEGYPTLKLGYTTGKTKGVITYTNYTTNFVYDGDSEPTKITDVIRYSNQSLGGDSGGPVYYHSGVKGSNYLIALNYAGPVDSDTYTYGIGCRITNVLAELNLKLITCENIFDYK